MLSTHGILYVVATPIGNLDDLTLRALAILKKVSHVACEDTRRTQILLQHLGLSKSLIILQSHNERAATQQCVQLLEAGTSIALVSDAGTPLISDPGFKLVSLAHSIGVKVVPIPGPSAVITALSALALPCEAFSFYGFLPSKTQQRCQRLEQIKDRVETSVFYEAPHRLEATLVDMNAVLGEARLAGLAREMTKQFEQIKRTSLGTLLAEVQSGEIPAKGECVLVVEGASSEPEQSEVDALLLALLKELPVKTVVQIVSDYFELPKNKIYRRALFLADPNASV